MLKRNLIEKPYDIMNDILLFLYNNDGAASKSTLAKEFQISMNTLNEYLSLLQLFVQEQQLQEDLAITVDNDKLKLFKANKFAVNHCHLLFIKKSIKYQLIKELFENEHLDASQFQQTHSISPATYYRKITELNQLLAEFDLLIKRNRLVGSEPQIRHFFFSFFWATNDELTIPPKEKSLLEKFFVLIEEHLQIEHEPSEILQLYLWLTVAQHRLPWSKHFEFPANFEAVERPLFAEVQLVLQQAAVTSGMPLLEHLMFYDFFVAMKNYSPLSAFASRLTRAHRQDETALSQINQTVLDYLAEKNYLAAALSQTRYQFIENLLLQIHSQTYYFKGFILNTDSWGINGLLLQLQTSFTKKDVTDLMEFCTLIFTDASYHCEFSSLLTEINYTTVFHQLSEVNQRQVTIAVDHSQNSYYRSLTIQFLKAHFATKYSCEIVPYKSNLNYDILLTNTGLEANQPTVNYTYVFADCTNNYDVRQIEKIIQSFFALKKYLH